MILRLFCFTIFVIVYYDRPTSIVDAWQQWSYSSDATNDWKKTWGFAEGPRGRQGHSMVLWDDTKVVLFGGRDNQVHRPHVPKTFDIEDDEGLLSFATYDEKPVFDTYDAEACQPVKTCVYLNGTEDEEACSYSWDHELREGMSSGQRDYKEEVCGFVTSGLYYNDVWVYDLNCTRYADLQCEDDGWRVLYPGVRHGGCQNIHGERVCDKPSERYNHGAAMIDENTMIIYGGYSQECEDYCDDVWTFTLDDLLWERLVVNASKNDSYSSDEYDPDSLRPGRRWRFSMISGVGNLGDNHDMDVDDEDDMSNDDRIIVVFGGHRLWHGFSLENSEENMWESVDASYPKGGYLDDLWILRKEQRGHTDGHSNQRSNDTYTWTKQIPQETCFLSPGLSWEERDNVECKVFWPKARAGHAATFDTKRNGMWIHGGFTAYYPYPSSSSAGSAEGSKAKRATGFMPFESESFFLDDLWFYNFSTGLWKELKPITSIRPRRRTDHIMFLTTNMLILHGGYSEDQHLNDTWYFYPHENRWLEKIEFVHASYPNDCTDDMKNIFNSIQDDSDNECIELTPPPPLKRATETTYLAQYMEVLPFSKQPGYTPDEDNPLYFGIVNDAENFVAELRSTYHDNKVYDKEGHQVWLHSSVPEGTPIAPRAATGPRQYARQKSIVYNSSLTLSMWEWCVSVQGEPTRDHSSSTFNSVHVHQPRRQSPGWDGCRELEWMYPASRSSHVGVYVEKFGLVVFYGGLGHISSLLATNSIATNESASLLSNSSASNIMSTIDLGKSIDGQPIAVLNDMWTFNVNNCPWNCSDHGSCIDGYCLCEPGYYGIDCSNATCPGSVCYYDDNHIQHCTHCCFDGYEHDLVENNTYISGVGKLPCHRHEDDGDGIFSGSSNGICDGFGTCQCAPPFLGEDCSIMDCKDDCNENGYCSLEFPVARCICNEGYFGETCQYIECLNNCSSPNGDCDHNTGLCRCKPIYSPFDQSKIWNYWQGEDCSYLPAWSACPYSRKHVFAFILVLITSLGLIID